MGVDLLRSCYTTDMAFWSDSAETVPVRWFFCDPGAKVLPHFTLFGSGNWASDRVDWSGPGEVLGATRAWNDGSTPGELLGQKFAGPIVAFEEGAVTTDLPLNASADGICCACTCIDCPCLEWMASLPPEMTVEVTGVTNLIPPAIAHVGQKFHFSRQAIPGQPDAQRGPQIINPANPLESFFLLLYCPDAGNLGSKILGRGDSFSPSSASQWDQNRCEPFDFTAAGWTVSFGFPPTLYELWDLRLLKGFVS